MSGSGRRRGTSISANSPEVVTTDKIRPDWATKLAAARAHAARRAAAATALHTAAYLMNGTESRGFGPFGRRRRPTLEGLDGSPAHTNALALLSERHALRQQEMDGGPGEVNQSPFLAPPRGSSSRRSRMEDLEDMMMMEAIRLSLASEEERRRKEDKEAKKEAKKKEKETKKAEKAAKKSGLYNVHTNTSYGEPAESAAMARTESVASSVVSDDGGSPVKGKGVDRTGSCPIAVLSHHGESPENGIRQNSPLETSQESLPFQFPSVPSEPARRSHLRHISNASSSASSVVDPTSTPSGGGAGVEPMFNFRSLAAMIGNEEDKVDGTSNLEHVDEAKSADLAAESPISDEGRKSATELNAEETHTVDAVGEPAAGTEIA